MALIPCPKCGKHISEKALSCPHCGYDMNKSVDASIASTAVSGKEQTKIYIEPISKSIWKIVIVILIAGLGVGTCLYISNDNNNGFTINNKSYTCSNNDYWDIFSWSSSEDGKVTSHNGDFEITVEDDATSFDFRYEAFELPTKGSILDATSLTMTLGHDVPPIDYEHKSGSIFIKNIYKRNDAKYIEVEFNHLKMANNENSYIFNGITTFKLW